MRIIDSILTELDQEGATTKRVLERVPEDKLAWKPHEKSMSLGELAWHIAEGPGAIATMVSTDCCDLDPKSFDTRVPAKTAEIVETFTTGLAAAKRILGEFDDATATRTWKLTKSGREMLSMPRIAFVRMVLLNHSYHHRGQLSVYLRLLGVPVPSIYGRSADENPFA